MTHVLQELLTTFDKLTPQEQHAAAVEILRRAPLSEGELSEHDLDSLAAELFESLDEAEAADADAAAR
uniref:Uncharacterized protein n=1 Tax=Schlesneria paludicola TaxID=360056 RepID=A0A7C2PFN4_9PLAN